jgi:hypothetical protein
MGLTPAASTISGWALEASGGVDRVLMNAHSAGSSTSVLSAGISSSSTRTQTCATVAKQVCHPVEYSLLRLPPWTLQRVSVGALTRLPLRTEKAEVQPVCCAFGERRY